jgi:hypothetical protein
VDDAIARKLDAIDALFPPERLAASRARWTRLWRGEAPLDRYPFTVGPFGIDYYAGDQNPARVLHRQLDEMCIRGVVDDDFIPAFFPGCRQSTMPSLFGVAEVEIDGDYSCARLTELALPDPDFGPGTVAHRWLAMQEFVLDATDGRLPVHPADTQGPADVCGKLFGYEALFETAYDDPARYHQVMATVTDACIAFWTLQQRLCGDLFVGTHLFAWNWVPADAGASMSVDSLVMVAPDFYDACYRPHLQRIGEAFGGLAVHACGDFSRVVPAVCATPGMRAVNAGQLSLPALHAAGADARTIISAGVEMAALADVFACIRAHRLRADLTVWGIWPADDGGVKPHAAWTEDDRAHLARSVASVHALAADAAAGW